MITEIKIKCDVCKEEEKIKFKLHHLPIQENCIMLYPKNWIIINKEKQIHKKCIKRFNKKLEELWHTK